MSKRRSKKKSNSNYRTISISAKGTIYQQFRAFMGKEPRTVEDVISFLHIQNARALSWVDKEVPQEKKDDLIEFFIYFMENFDQLTHMARMREWGDEPLVLRMGYKFYMEEHDRERDKYLASISKNTRIEAESLRDKLFAIRADRYFSVVFPDGDSATLNLDATIPKNRLDDSKTELLWICAQLVESSGGLTVRCQYRNKTEVFGIAAKHGRWVPIAKQEILDAHTLAPDGTRLKPEEGVVYTEISRDFHDGNVLSIV